MEFPLGVLVLIGNGVRLNAPSDVQVGPVDDGGEQEGGDDEDDEPQEVVLLHNPNELIDPAIEEQMSYCKAGRGDCSSGNG